ncbi:MAG: hypothetical protein JJT78_16525 [Leptospira sp.]|nr:hypothetical protein [Leptospira sp.]
MNQISDYAIIGDCHSLSLVGKDGSIDWCCFPHFDSPSVFAKVLDEKKGGYFRISPRDGQIESIQRSYREGTNVLETIFTTATGKLKLTDCMTLWRDEVSGKTLAHHSILRKLEVVEGQVEVAMDLASRFEYASFVPRYRLTSSKTGEIVGGADALWITSTLELTQEEEAFSFDHKISQGDVHWVEISWSNSFLEKSVADHPHVAELERRFEATVDF